jgi:uncharacterized protein
MILDAVRNIAQHVWSTLLAMAPYLLLGFLVAGVLSVLISPAWVRKRLGGRGLRPILLAALFGVPLPLCSCGVIPVAVSLRRFGAGKGATTAFLLSTPQTGVDSIMATFSLLGPVFALFRPIAAFITGVLGGLTVQACSPADEEVAVADPPSPDDRCACEAQEENAPAREFLPLRVLRYGFATLPRDIARPLLIGLLVAGVISAAVPSDFFAGRLGSGWPAMLAMMLLGLPLYVCATSSIPVAAAMIGVGLSPGAALVFLMTGPATNAAAIATLWKLFGRRVALLYLAVVAVSALLAGAALNRVFAAGDFAPVPGAHSMLPGPAQTFLALALLAVLAYALKPVGRKE